MQKLTLHHNEILKGNFELKKLNFLFVFQVNCPGCFLHGIPLVNKLYKEFGNRVSFLGLSTAFEDYEYNNLKSTKQLLFRNEVVGETKKKLRDHDIDPLSINIEFPIAMDTIANNEYDYNNGVKQICQINPNYKIWPEFEQEALRKRVITYLKSQELISLTFTLNQLKGTPSIVVFNDDHEILYSKFGHIDFSTIKLQLDNLINDFHSK